MYDDVRWTRTVTVNQRSTRLTRMMRAVAVALLIAVAVLAWREQQFERHVAQLEQTSQRLSDRVALLEYQSHARFKHDEDEITKSMREGQKHEAIDRAQTAFALGQYENAIDIVDGIVGSQGLPTVAPQRAWRILIASACALKQGDRARAYANQFLGQSAKHDQLVVFECTKNHIDLPDPPPRPHKDDPEVIPGHGY